MATTANQGLRNRSGKKMADQTTEQPDPLEAEFNEATAKANETNKTRTGIGTRVAVGKTRGRATAVFSYEHFDDSLPDTLPKTYNAAVEALKAIGLGTEEPEIVELIILGANEKLYKSASDELASYVNPVWDKAVQNMFRLTVRNYARGTGDDIDDVAKMMRAAFDKKHVPAAPAA